MPHTFYTSRSRFSALPCIVGPDDSGDHDHAARSGRDLKVFNIRHRSSHCIINGFREPACVVKLTANVVRDW